MGNYQGLWSIARGYGYLPEVVVNYQRLCLVGRSAEFACGDNPNRAPVARLYYKILEYCKKLNFHL